MKPIHSALVICVVHLFLVVPALAAADSPPRVSSAQLLEQAERCREMLKTSLVDFYLPACVDTVHGGYLESLRDGEFAHTGEKFLTLQARQLWFFSTLAVEGYETEAALAAARTGFEFIEGKMRDRRHGGYFSKVTDAGERRDPRKHAYHNAFAMYALAAYHRAGESAAALKAAQDLFHVLEEKAYDRKNGGYIEFFHEDWRPITDPKEPGYIGAIGHKTYNTHLHLLEAFAELYRVWPDDLLRERLMELVHINIHTVRHHEHPHNIDAWFPDWSMVDEPRNLRASYGHDVECAWLTLDAVQTLGLPVAVFRNWAESLCRSSIEYGYDPEHGGFYGGGNLARPADDTRKIWWVQSEGLAAMLKMFKLTGNPEFHRRFSQTLDFVERHQIAPEGGWWAIRAADGSPTRDTGRTGPWQSGYHAGRALILCARWLEELAGGPAANR